MEDCIFCQIIEGEIPSRKVYEDEDVYAFLDVNPLSRGHTLVVPKTHKQKLEDLPSSESNELFDAVHRLTGPVTDAVDAPACNVALNNGSEAGQEVPHLHVHIVPRKEGDGGGAIHSIMPKQLDMSDEELDEVLDEIQKEVE